MNFLNAVCVCSTLKSPFSKLSRPTSLFAAAAILFWAANCRGEIGNTNSLDGKWHEIEVLPRRDLPKIHFYDKLNPVWWLKNSDEPVPPADYKRGDKLRKLKWHFRNPFHNFSNYVIGISDKKFTRSGRYPNQISSPRGGWNFSVAHRTWRWLPLISYRRGRFEFYFGWRERGNFGAKINVKNLAKTKRIKPA